MKPDSILIFGAGKIGRSFIGQLFSRSGYEVVFAEVDLAIVEALNQRRSYPVVIKGDREETLLIQNVRAVNAMDTKVVVEEVAKASILAVSVGKNALEKVIPLIAEGLLLRYQANGEQPLDIIIAENMRSASEFIHQKLKEKLPANYPLHQLVGLVETSIGKMVPIMEQADWKRDPLQVFAEPYNDLIVDQRGFKGSLPEVAGLSPKENIQAWVDRKAFIHNMGHATVAYYGSCKHPEATFIYEVLSDPDVFAFAESTMRQAARVLLAVYPDDFTAEGLIAHVKDLLQRFQNRALRDTIFRVGQDLPRKLGPDDRFMGIIRLADKVGISCDPFLEAVSYAFFFKATDENGFRAAEDERFEQLLQNGLPFTLYTICELDPELDKVLIDRLLYYYERFKK